MNSVLVPDLIAMVVLLCVLARVWRRYSRHNIRLWLAGLLLVLLECVARIVYEATSAGVPHRLAHAVALDSYLVAGLLFLRSSLINVNRPARNSLFVWSNTLPALVLLTLYGLAVGPDRLYVVVAVVGMLTAVGTCLFLHRSRLHLVALLGLWVPVLLATALYPPRYAVYLLLASVYLFTAAVFASTLPGDSSGRVAVVTGFAVWAGCFATHPWVAEMHGAWQPFVGEIWNLQKFLITVGFLLVLFEKQVDSNEWLALHDQLTGLPNRRLYEDRISNSIARAERDHTALILFTMDLNNFKEVNDTLGHDAGDELLRSLAASLRHVVRRTDTLARIGGDEFVLLAGDVKTARTAGKPRRWLRPEERQANSRVEDWPLSWEDSSTPSANHPVLHHASRIEQELRTAANQPVLLKTLTGTATVEVSISIGVAIYPIDSTTLAELTRVADSRMYADKRRQRAERGPLSRVLSMLSA